MAGSRDYHGADINNPQVGLTGDYHFGNEALERAEFEAKLHPRKKRHEHVSLIERLKSLLGGSR